MKKSILAVALMFGFVSAANAGFYCKLNEGQSFCAQAEHKAEQQCNANTGTSRANQFVLEWHWGDQFPDTTPFKYESKDVVCFIDAGLLYTVMDQVWGGVTRIPSLEYGLTQKYGSGPKVGVIHRGDEARFLIDNLRSVPYTNYGEMNVNPGNYLSDFVNKFNP